jgi:hypothetical protein
MMVESPCEDAVPAKKPVSDPDSPRKCDHLASCRFPLNELLIQKFGQTACDCAFCTARLQPQTRHLELIRAEGRLGWNVARIGTAVC